ncbi:hypothetical protein C9374_002379 [Naegleria lovaniensis]|uniref:Mitochondrial import inner membrane translocase subunit TIM50 n=1 Tax=Naegleria lovaniensis TaxID=51637 RepID=A0AA88KKC4_NAELO|nr:uncharacterized protein C9374_002379 [Naegleria lovaniensis]KAG2386635.1 hypothetical protein C9374_002379 [Naegleria lovaniensis]
MKRVATVGAKFYKSHNKLVHSPSSSSTSSSSSFTSLSELAEYHGVFESESLVNPSSTTTQQSTIISPLRHVSASCDDLSNMFEHLALDNNEDCELSAVVVNDDQSNMNTTPVLIVVDKLQTNTTVDPSSQNLIPDTTKDSLTATSPSSCLTTITVATAVVDTADTTHKVVKSTSPKILKKKKSKIAIPPQAEHHQGRKTIVLDLDETLIKSFHQEPDTFDFTIDIEFPHLGQMVSQHVYIKTRPGLNHFLEQLHAQFELVMFTAALPVYANSILKHIDPEGKYFSHVLYRHHCNGAGSFPGKDLRILGRDLSNTILVDDGVLNFLQPRNGLLIKSFKGEDDDKVLSDIVLPFLLQLSDPSISVYEIVEKYRNFLAITYTFEYSDSIEKSHYTHYINLNSRQVEHRQLCMY